MQITYRQITCRRRRQPSRLELRLARLMRRPPAAHSQTHRIDLIGVADLDLEWPFH